MAPQRSLANSCELFWPPWGLRATSALSPRPKMARTFSTSLEKWKFEFAWPLRACGDYWSNSLWSFWVRWCSRESASVLQRTVADSLWLRSTSFHSAVLRCSSQVLSAPRFARTSSRMVRTPSHVAVDVCWCHTCIFLPNRVRPPPGLHNSSLIF